MPHEDLEGYPQGHFNRVYEYVIAPACRSASFTPERVNDALALTGDLLDAYKTLVESEMVICDFSGLHQSVGYGFVLRKALNLPVVLVKDIKTPAMGATDEFGCVTYDESLRIDTVQSETNALTEAINQAYHQKGEHHSLLNSIQQGEIQTSVAADEEDKKEKKLPIISPLPEYVGEPFSQPEMDKLKVGDFLFHLTRGKGEITSVKNAGREKLAGIKFDSGTTVLVLGASDYFRKIADAD